MIGDKIIDLANKYVGKKELKGNSGFEDKKFEEDMITMGWEYGWAWCAVFCELVWRLSYAKENAIIEEEVAKAFSPSAVQTLKNLGRTDFVISTTPVKGAVAIWQKYKNGTEHWSGHAAIVEKVDTSKEHPILYTIDGNSNDAGQREGIKVVKKARPLSFQIKDGLVLKGFIHPKEP